MKSRVVNFSTTRHSIFLSKKNVTLHPVIVACSQLITIVGPAEGPKIWRDNWISFLKDEGCASIMVKNWNLWGPRGETRAQLVPFFPPGLLRMFTQLFVILHFLRFLSFHSWVKDLLMFRYCQKATEFEIISHFLKISTYWTQNKMGCFFQMFVVFSENLNFNAPMLCLHIIAECLFNFFLLHFFSFFFVKKWKGFIIRIMITNLQSKTNL